MTTQTDNVTTDENAPATAADVTTADTTATAEVDGGNGAPAQEDDAATKYAESSREAKYLAESKKVLRDGNYLFHLSKHNRKLAERIAAEDMEMPLESALKKVEVEQAEKLEADNTYLVELSKKNPYLAGKLVQEKFGTTLDAALKQVGDYIE